MTIELLEQEIKKQFPASLGCIYYTGNTSIQTFLQLTYIPVIVLDPYYSQIYTYTIGEAQRIKATIFPISDAENILYNESLILRNSLLQKISEGEILYDVHTITAAVKQIAISIITQQSGRSDNRIRQLAIQLQKIHVQLRKDNLSAFDKLIINSELTNIITAIELAKIEYRELYGLMKARKIEEQCEQFSKDLTEASVQFLQYNSYAQFSDLIINVLNYRQTKSILLPDSEIIFNLQLPDASLQYIESTILPLINENDLLRQCFNYYALSDKKYSRLYRYQLSLSFTPSNAGIPYKDLTSTLRIVFTPHIPDLIFQLFPNKQRNPEAQNLLTTFLSDISAVHTTLIQTNNYEEQLIKLSVVIGKYLASKLHLQQKDLVKLNVLLSNRWLFTKKEQQYTHNYFRLIVLKQEKFKAHKSYLEANNIELLYAFHQSVEESLLMAAYPHLKLAIASLNKLLDADINDHPCKQLLEQIIAVTGLESPATGLVYIMLIPELFHILNMDANQKVLSLFILSQDFGI